MYANDVDIGSDVTISGKTTTGQLVINGGTNVGTLSTTNSSTGNIPVIIGSPTGRHIAIDADEIAGKGSATTPANLWLNYGGGTVYLSTGQQIYASNGTFTTPTLRATNIGDKDHVASTAYIATGNITTLNTDQVNVKNIEAENVDVKYNLKASHYDLQTVSQLGGVFRVAPSISIPSTVTPSTNVKTTSVTVTKSSSSATITIVDNSIVNGNSQGDIQTETPYIGGITWASGAYVMCSGTIGDVVTGTMFGKITTINTNSRTLTLNITSGYDGLVAGTYSASQISGLTVVLYKNHSNYPVGIELNSYGTSVGRTYVDVYGGTSNEPSVRIGNIGGLSYNGGTLENQWGIYTDNGYFKGAIVSTEGKIGGFTIDQTKLFNGTNSLTSTATGVYLGTDGIRNYNTTGSKHVTIKDGTITANSVDLTGAINATSGAIGGFKIDTTSIRTNDIAVTSNADNSIALSSADFTRTILSTSRSGLRFAIGDKFAVTGDGVLYTNGANITSINAGNITTGTLSADVIGAGSLSIGKLDSTTQTKFNNVVKQSIESIIGTQTSNTYSWTGTSTTLSASDIVDGLTINYFLPYSVGGSQVGATYLRLSDNANVNTNGVVLNLTLADGTTTGNIPVWYQGVGRLTSHYGYGAIIKMTYHKDVVMANAYKATGWWVDAQYNSDTVDNRIVYFTGKTGEKGIWAGSLFMEDSVGTYQNICTASDGTVTTASSGNGARTTATTKKANTNGFKVGGTIYYTGTSYNANTNITGTNTIFSSYGNVFDSRYCMNTTLTAGSLATYKPWYLVGSINATDGLFYLDTTWWTQTPNTTGKVYILGGGVYDSSTSYCRITLYENNMWYVYDGTRLVPYEKYASDSAAKTATTYITDIDSNKGITIKPSNSSGNDYLQMNSSAISFYRNNVETVKLEDSAFRIGKLGTNMRNIYVTDSAVQIRNNTTPLAEYGSDIKFYDGTGNATTNIAAQIGSTGISIKKGDINLGSGTFTVSSTGNITAKDGSIGGWTISPSSIYSSDTSTIKSIVAGTRTASSTGNGVYIASNGVLNIGEESGNYLTFDGTNLDLKTDWLRFDNEDKSVIVGKNENSSLLIKENTIRMLNPDRFEIFSANMDGALQNIDGSSYPVRQLFNNCNGVQCTAEGHMDYDFVIANGATIKTSFSAVLYENGNYSGTEADNSISFTKGTAQTINVTGRKSGIVYTIEYDGNITFCITCTPNIDKLSISLDTWVSFYTSSPSYTLGTRKEGARGAFSTTLGERLVASGEHQTVIGVNNTEDADKLFIIGNGGNVLTVSKSGTLNCYNHQSGIVSTGVKNATYDGVTISCRYRRWDDDFVEVWTTTSITPRAANTATTKTIGIPFPNFLTKASYHGFVSIQGIPEIATCHVGLTPHAPSGDNYRYDAVTINIYASNTTTRYVNVYYCGTLTSNI